MLSGPGARPSRTDAVRNVMIVSVDSIESSQNEDFIYVAPGSTAVFAFAWLEYCITLDECLIMGENLSNMGRLSARLEHLTVRQDRPRMQVGSESHTRRARLDKPGSSNASPTV